MIRLKFIVRENVLVLRISEDRQRYYKSVKHLLKGNPNIERHWNGERERFSSYAVSYIENNKTLNDLKDSYLSLIRENPELSARQVAQYYTSSRQNRETETESKDNTNLVSVFLKTVIEREKAKQGCNYENYTKLYNKCEKVLKDFPSLTFQSINYNKCVKIARIFAGYKGYLNTAKSFRNLLGKASKDAGVNFVIGQIGDFNFNSYNPNVNEIDTKRPDVLTPEQLKTFLTMDVATITPSYRDRKQVELYYDFCVFMFHSFFSPCDVIKLRYRDIDRQDIIRVKRKKTHKPVEIPVNPVMKKIVDKYRGQTKDGYVFPIMDDEKEKEYAMKDYLFKKFQGRVCLWLKSLGRELKTDYPMYPYVFRHTSITVALDNGIPISYVAVAAGTSIDMIQKHYYNGNNPKNAENLQKVFINASV